jgi:hypothetical protein
MDPIDHPFLVWTYQSASAIDLDTIARPGNQHNVDARPVWKGLHRNSASGADQRPDLVFLAVHNPIDEDRLVCLVPSRLVAGLEDAARQDQGGHKSEGE